MTHYIPVSQIYIYIYICIYIYIYIIHIVYIYIYIYRHIPQEHVARAATGCPPLLLPRLVSRIFPSPGVRDLPVASAHGPWALARLGRGLVAARPHGCLWWGRHAGPCRRPSYIYIYIYIHDRVHGVPSSGMLGVLQLFGSGALASMPQVPAQ